MIRRLRHPLCGLAALSLACLAQTTPIKVGFDVPPTDVGVALDSVSVMDFQARRRDQGAAMAQAIRSGIAQAGFVRVVGAGGTAVLQGTLEVGRVRSERENSSFLVPQLNGGNKRVYVHKLRKRVATSATYVLHRGGTMLGATPSPTSLTTPGRALHLPRRARPLPRTRRLSRRSSQRSRSASCARSPPTASSARSRSGADVTPICGAASPT